MTRPEPFKYQCPKCGYTKIVKPTSDILMPEENICPKCGTLMKYKKLNILQEQFFKIF